jgi:adenosylmethionine-8-amino-7-oxononanoate aminotransferase
VAHRLTEKAREHGLVVYPSTGCAGDGEGDLVMIGPPLIVRDDEIEILAALLSAALDGMK